VVSRAQNGAAQGVFFVLGLLALRRYLPYLRPYIGLVAIFGIAQLGSLAASAEIPKVIQYIIDGPITHRQLGQMAPLAALLITIGLSVRVHLPSPHYQASPAAHGDRPARRLLRAPTKHCRLFPRQLAVRAAASEPFPTSPPCGCELWPDQVSLQTIVTFAVVFVLMWTLDWRLASRWSSHAADACSATSHDKFKE
jgi:hypothetical protein